MSGKAAAAATDLAQARILYLETQKGYPEHYWLALGHMAEAEDELLEVWPDLAEEIRKSRKMWEDDRARVPDFLALIRLVTEATGLN